LNGCDLQAFLTFETMNGTRPTDLSFATVAECGQTTRTSVPGRLAIHVVHDDDLQWDLGALNPQPQLLSQRGSY